MSTQEIYQGLTNEEVELSRSENGSNKSDIEDQGSFWPAFKEVVSEPLFLILVCAALVYFFLGESTEGIIMLIALSIVSGLSIFQENRSRNAVDALKKISAPTTKVIRNGITECVAASEIVVGDLIILEDGNMIPADALLLKINDLSINESILTGESLAVSKSIEEPNNKIFQGTLLMSGSCIAKVIAVGKQTALGKIGESLSQISSTKTPLQLQIKKFIKAMVIAGIIAFGIVFSINFYLTKSLLHGLLHGLTLAMSILPEEIPMAFSTFMALGAYHLYKKQVIARSPYTVETLGAATVICVDKTGTITENEMQLAGIYEYKTKQTYDYTQETFNMNEVLEYALWASETDPFDEMEKSIHKVYTEVTEHDKRASHVLIYEYPLGGNPPFMTHVFSDKKDSHIIACKGSVEGILRQTTLSESEKENILKQAKHFASKGYRILAVAKANHDINQLPSSQHHFEFTFIGLIAFNDPPKKNMREILEQFYQAGISVKMITGDHAETALAIAKQIDFKNNNNTLTGTEVMSLTDEQLQEKVQEVHIYARMFPEAKLKVIQALQAKGEVVAMTGDGVNDAPALKAAHIGISMGLRGSEVAKNAASLILVDDDLFHMTEAVALGRRIYENLKKAIQYIISIHIPVILIVTLPLVFFWKMTDFFTPVHVIILELIMGPTCSIIFENEPIEANSMRKKPRKLSTSFFSLHELSTSILQGIFITAACLGLAYFFIQNHASETYVRTIIYTTLIFSNLFLTLANRSFYYSIRTTIRYKNNLIPLVLMISLIALFTSIYFSPVQKIFMFEALTFSSILMCFMAAFAGVMWIELYKMYIRKKSPTPIKNE